MKDLKYITCGKCGKQKSRDCFQVNGGELSKICKWCCGLKNTGSPQFAELTKLHIIEMLTEILFRERNSLDIKSEMKLAQILDSIQRKECKEMEVKNGLD